MIKVGDKVKFKKYDETIYTVVNVEDEDVRVINNKGSQLMQISKDFIEVVEPYIDYKLRADRAEKRWSELREQMEHDEKEAFGEGDVIAYTVHNYVLELMRDLEEDGE